MKKFIFSILLSSLLYSEDLGYLLFDENLIKNKNLLFDKQKINLIFDIKNKNYKNIDSFLSKYEINFMIKDRNTPLFYAIDLEDFKIVKLFIEHGANIYHVNNNLENALHIAVKKNNVKIVNYLLEEGVKIDNKDIAGNTALFYAKQNANNEIIELINYYKKSKKEAVDSLEDFIKNF